MHVNSSVDSVVVVLRKRFWQSGNVVWSVRKNNTNYCEVTALEPDVYSYQNKQTP